MMNSQNYFKVGFVAILSGFLLIGCGGGEETNGTSTPPFSIPTGGTNPTTAPNIDTGSGSVGVNVGGTDVDEIESIAQQIAEQLQQLQTLEQDVANAAKYSKEAADNTDSLEAFAMAWAGLTAFQMVANGFRTHKETDDVGTAALAGLTGDQNIKHAAKTQNTLDDFASGQEKRQKTHFKKMEGMAAATLETMTAFMGALGQKLDKIEATSTASDTKLQQLKNQYRALNQRLETLQASSDKAATAEQVKAIKDEMKSVETKIETVQGSLDELKSLKTEHQALNQRLESLQTSLNKTATAEQMDAVTEEMRIVQAEIDRLAAQASALEQATWEAVGASEEARDATVATENAIANASFGPEDDFATDVIFKWEELLSKLEKSGASELVAGLTTEFDRLSEQTGIAISSSTTNSAKSLLQRLQTGAEEKLDILKQQQQLAHHDHEH